MSPFCIDWIVATAAVSNSNRPDNNAIIDIIMEKGNFTTKSEYRISILSSMFINRNSCSIYWRNWLRIWCWATVYWHIPRSTVHRRPQCPFWMIFQRKLITNSLALHVTPRRSTAASRHILFMARRVDWILWFSTKFSKTLNAYGLQIGMPHLSSNTDWE